MIYYYNDMARRFPRKRRIPFRSSLSYGYLAVLVAILVILAVLQYRWIGQVSEADRERMQISLNTSVSHFHQDYLRELYRACSAFRPEPRPDVARDLPRVAQDHIAWKSTASYPDLISDVYVWWFGHGQTPQFWKLDMKSEKPQPAKWEPRLEIVHQRLAGLRRRLGTPPRFERIGRFWTMHASVPALTRPLVEFPIQIQPSGPPRPYLVGFIIVELNLNCIKQQLLPDLARRHFGIGDGSVYEAAVLVPGQPGKTIYRSSPNFGRSELASAAARIELIDTPRGDFEPEQPVGERAPERASGSAGVERRETFGSGLQILTEPEYEHWQLAVWHKFGTLNSVVEGVRRRNLAVSFGVLLLLAVAVGTVIVLSQRAQRLAKLQIDFVAGVSHELRTPVAVICSAGENLADGVVRSREQVQEYGELVRAHGRRLRSMVEQVLDFAADEAGRRFDLRRVSPARLIKEVLAESSPMIQEAGFSTDEHIPEGLPDVFVDELAVKHCLQNLLNNAVKYSGDSRWLGIRAAVQGNDVQITVEDKGLGIDPEDRHHIFEPFYRGEAATAGQIHGTGLGLSLAASVASAMGGKITVKSTPGKGSAFTLHLPKAEAGREYATERKG
ncbi:MAG: HAMP domain-containing sensor histidine kinase [Bryobacteraceae bacterium]